ncbi:MAG TPA: hypothetical protein VHZ31_08060 [Solirubrobacteraceae bacterium]|jgi:cell wall-associated NlpC family hydrolase|nr:hypothetical protein [Solirubrobacteraceae bacterium]
MDATDPVPADAAAPVDDLPFDDLPPDEDDYDLADVPDPADVAFDDPPDPATEGDDQVVAGYGPQPTPDADAPIDPLDPFSDPTAMPIFPISQEPQGEDDATIVRRWLPRLAYRRQLLADARAELAAATTDAAKRAARAKVAVREDQVAYAQRIIERHRKPQTTVVERIVRAAMFCYKHRDQIGYTQDRPEELHAQGGVARRWEGISKGLRTKNGQFPGMADCSSFVTWCYWDALGGPNAGPDIVNGEHWAAGYTGSQTQHGSPVAIADARAGDLAFYIREHGAIGHVTVVVAPGKVVSHGGTAGPLLLAIDWPGSRLDSVRRYLS